MYFINLDGGKCHVESNERPYEKREYSRLLSRHNIMQYLIAIAHVNLVQIMSQLMCCTAL